MKKHKALKVCKTALLIKTVIFIITTVTFSNCAKEIAPICPESVLSYDGNTYGVTQIGNQCWLTSNLRATTYADGTDIPIITDNEEWANLNSNDTSDACCYINNNVQNVDPFGVLYTWSAAMGDNAISSVLSPSGVQGTCPDGYHIPSKAEWQTLINYLSDNDQNASALQTTTGWLSGTNDYRFTAYPSGIRKAGNGAFELGLTCYWTASENNDDEAWAIYMGDATTKIIHTNESKSYGYSVRCIKD